jgi:type II secretory pathway component PulM
MGWWQTRTARERTALLLGALALCGAALYLALEPRLERRALLEAELPRLQADLAWMRANAGEFIRLRERDVETTAAPTAPLAPGTVEEVLKRLQLLEQVSGLRPDGSRNAIVVSFDAAPYAMLLELAHQLRAQHGARVRFARIDAIPERPGMVRAELGFTRAPAAP